MEKENNERQKIKLPSVYSIYLAILKGICYLSKNLQQVVAVCLNSGNCFEWTIVTPSAFKGTSFFVLPLRRIWMHLLVVIFLIDFCVF